MPDHFEKAMHKNKYYTLNLAKPINLKETKKAATSKVFGVKYCEGAAYKGSNDTNGNWAKQLINN